MDFESMVNFGLMRKLESGEYVLTLKGQRVYSGKHNWLPTPQPKQKTTRADLDNWLGVKLQWENETTDRERD